MHQKEIRKEEKEAGVDYATVQKRLKFSYPPDVQMLSGTGAPGSKPFEEELEKLLCQDVDAMRLDLYYRCTAAVGVLTDTANLYVGNNGSLNGFVVGENGKALVETITAGGYNIQRLHYRVLIKPVREYQKQAVPFVRDRLKLLQDKQRQVFRYR